MEIRKKNQPKRSRLNKRSLKSLKTKKSQHQSHLRKKEKVKWLPIKKNKRRLPKKYLLLKYPLTYKRMLKQHPLITLKIKRIHTKRLDYSIAKRT